MRPRTFTRKADADRFFRELDAEQVRGRWVDPRNADTPVGVWAEEFLLLCRRRAATTQETDRRDLEKYVLPRFGGHRLGQLPADEIENWLDDEIAAGIAAPSVHRHCRARAPDGGLGARAHGTDPPTEDVDDTVVARSTPDNLSRVAAARRELGARLRVGGMPDDEARQLPVVIEGATLAAFGSSTWPIGAAD